MKEQFFKGLKGAPVGVIPGIGKSGPGVIVEAEGPEHARAIKATGFYEPTDPPKQAAPQESEAPTPTLAPAAVLEADTAEAKTPKKAGKE